MDQAEFRLSLWKWITKVLNPSFDVDDPEAGESDIIVIEANTDGPRPAEAYLTYDIIAAAEPGLPSRGALDGVTGFQDIYIDRLPTVSLQGYMKAAEAYLYKVKESIYLVDTQEHLKELGISIHSIEDVQDVSGLLDKTREKRWNMDIHCNYGRKLVDENAGVIETIDYAGEFLPPE